MSVHETRLGLDDFNDVPTSDPASRPRHSWVPRSLIELAANPPEPPTIGALLYPGKRTLLSGETESLKTWLALILAKAEMALEMSVAWVDLDDMGAGAILQRLRALHVPDQQINDQFLYYQPDQRLQDRVLEEVILQLTVTHTRLMVIDAFTGALHLHGLDPNSSTDIETFWREIADPIAKAGAAPCLLDHVVKDQESRGKYATGSERKASGATVHLGTHSLIPLAIGGTGRSLITVHKDRPGYLPRPALGALVLESDGEHIEYKLDADRSHETGAFRPTILMERVSQTLELQNEPVSLNWVETNVKGKAPALRTAVEALLTNGYLEQTTGPRNSRQLSTTKPYREADDPLLDDLVPTSSPARPFGGEFATSTTSSPVPLLSGGDEVGRGRTGEGTRSSPEDIGTRSNNGQKDPPADLFADSQPDPDERDPEVF